MTDQFAALSVEFAKLPNALLGVKIKPSVGAAECCQSEPAVAVPMADELAVLHLDDAHHRVTRSTVDL